MQQQEPAITHRSWQNSAAAFLNPKVITMLFLGISAGLPLLLIFSSLSLWLSEAGLEKSAVTYFSWAALGYSFKFIWAPLVDQLPVPILTKHLGKRRAWLFLSQLMVMTAIMAMAMINPATGDSALQLMAIAAVCLGFSSATQDIVIDAFRIEAVDSDLQAMMSSTYIAGYRIGMILSGAGALLLASYFGSSKDVYNYQAWQYTYQAMALLMFIGIAATLYSKEPEKNKSNISQHSSRDHVGFIFMFILAIAAFITTFILSNAHSTELKVELTNLFGHKPLISFCIESFRLFLATASAVVIALLTIELKLVNKAMVDNTYVAPLLDFFQRYGKSNALILLALIALYRISDIVLGAISNVFYQDLGFTKVEIASVVKTFGLFMTIAGGFLGGLLSAHYGVIRILFLGALLTVVTNLLFMLLAQSGHDLYLLYFVISADNLSAGLASAAFIAFLSSLTNVSFTAVQYAIFSSLMTLLPKILGGYSGSMAESLGYSQFFLVASIMGLPVLVLIWIIHQKKVGVG